MSNFSFLETEDGVIEIVQHNPERFSHAAEIIQNMLRGPSELSVIERELIFAYVSACNACSFCVGVHQGIAQAFGLDPGILEKLLGTESSESVDGKLRPCLQLAEKVAKESSRVEKKDISTVIEAGWTEETAHDVISIAALATFYNLLVNGHGVSGSQEYFRKAAGIAGPNGGYT